MGLTVLDAGVLIAVLDPNDKHHAGSIEAVRGALERLDSLVIPASAYAELLVHPLRVGPTEADRVDALIDDLPATVQPCDRAIARSAAAIRARAGRSIRLPDALVIATAAALGADMILTTDRAWPNVDVAVTVVP